MKMIVHPATQRPFIIAHLFHAPCERVWRAWTERDRLMRWFGPAGVTLSAATLDQLIIEWAPLNPTSDERRTFDSSHDSMRQGWSGMFGQLTGYLVNA